MQLLVLCSVLLASVVSIRHFYCCQVFFVHVQCYYCLFSLFLIFLIVSLFKISYMSTFALYACAHTGPCLATHLYTSANINIHINLVLPSVVLTNLGLYLLLSTVYHFYKCHFELAGYVFICVLFMSFWHAVIV